jgi:hypothetical protein
MDIWVMQLPNGFVMVHFLSDRAKTWADRCEYFTVTGFYCFPGRNEYLELLNNLDPDLTVIDDGGMIHG